MKKLLFAFGILLFTSKAGECVAQPASLGVVQASTATFTGAISLWQQTKAQVGSLTPTRADQILICTDCTANASSKVCISTGTGQGAWSILIATGTICR